MIEVRLTGLKATQEALKSIGYLVTPADMRDSVRYAAVPAVNMAKANIPRGDKIHTVSSKGTTWSVFPGYAKSTLKSKQKIHKDKKGATARIGVIHPAFYAAQFVEFGTETQEAQPWLEPAFVGTRTEQLGRFVKWWGRKLKRVKKARGVK